MNLTELKKAMATIENLKNEGYDHVIFSHEDGGYCILAVNDIFSHIGFQDYTALDVTVWSLGGEFLESYQTEKVAQAWWCHSLDPLLEVPYEVHMITC